MLPALVALLLAAPVAFASTPSGPVPGYPKTMQVCVSTNACVVAVLEESVVQCGPAGSGWWGSGGYWCTWRGNYRVSGVGCWSLSVSQPFADDVGSSSFGMSGCGLTTTGSFQRTDWHYDPFTRSDTITYDLCLGGHCAQLRVPITYTAD